MKEFEILDPTAEEESAAWALAAGLDSSRSHRVGLLDISKPQGDIFLDELEACLVALGHSVSRYRKPTTARPAISEVVSEMAESCDAAVVALAD